MFNFADILHYGAGGYKMRNAGVGEPKPDGLWQYVIITADYSRNFQGCSPTICSVLRINDCIEKGYTEYSVELKTLMMLKFQTFENAQILAV